jgi:hypothetical protein
MQNQLQKAINLAKITGDRVIVVDSSKSEDVFVIMNLDEYEKFVLGQNELRNLTEEELLDKINRDVAIWKSENDGNYRENTEFIPKKKEKKQEPEEESMYYYQDPAFNELDWDDKEDDFEGKEDDDFEDKTFGNEKDEKPKNHWAIPGSVKSSAEEVVEDIPF